MRLPKPNCDPRAVVIIQWAEKNRMPQSPHNQLAECATLLPTPTPRLLSRTVKGITWQP